MIDETIGKIERRVQEGTSISEMNKRDLLDLLAKLRAELGSLSETHGEQAESITGFVERSAHEATRKDPNPKLLGLAIDGLSTSVQEFESSHPLVAETVNSIAAALANLGI